jgi:hypothetical protein
VGKTLQAAEEGHHGLVGLTLSFAASCQWRRRRPLTATTGVVLLHFVPVLVPPLGWVLQPPKRV